MDIHEQKELYESLDAIWHQLEDANSDPQQFAYTIRRLLWASEQERRVVERWLRTVDTDE